MIDAEEREILLDEIKQGKSNYLLINVIAKRVRSYQLGESPLVDLETGADPIDIAMEEMRRDRLMLQIGKEIPEEPEEESSADEEE